MAFMETGTILRAGRVVGRGMDGHGP